MIPDDILGLPGKIFHQLPCDFDRVGSMLPVAFPAGTVLFFPAEDAEIMAQRTFYHRRDIGPDMELLQSMADSQTLFGDPLRMITHGGTQMMRLAERLLHFIGIQDLTSVILKIVPDLFFLLFAHVLYIESSLQMFVRECRGDSLAVFPACFGIIQTQTGKQDVQQKELRDPCRDRAVLQRVLI